MEFLVFIVMAALVILPLFRLLPAFGINPYWALVAVFPLAIVVLLWVMAGRLDHLRGGAS
ncbi:hypothetical protein [Pararhodobacter sp. SW119]|uniref:hypothetical protein n=1 Tax=Pararhodobacter sp. SW119 TaxID=2780075 RepID=UPI001AE0069B|nr:hypothetical protein [Pararhodobacter sp. SW119]